MAEKTVDELLQELLARDLDDLEVKQDKLKDIYKDLPSMIKQVSELTSIEPRDLVQWSARSAILYQNLRWYEVLEILRIFYQTKRRVEKERR